MLGTRVSCPRVGLERVFRVKERQWCVPAVDVNTLCDANNTGIESSRVAARFGDLYDSQHE